MARRRRQNFFDDVMIISDDSSPPFVDLTQESPVGASSVGQATQTAHFFTTPSSPAHFFTPFSSPANEIVDLTRSDSSPVILDPVIPEGVGRRRRQYQRTTRSTRSTRRHSPYANHGDIIIDSDEENDVLVLSPVDVNNTRPWSELPSDVTPAPDTSSTPIRKQVKCPVCMDNESQIRESGLQLTSTVCGHIFCNRCIRGAIQTQHRCPTCRHKLTIKQIHPIFL